MNVEYIFVHVFHIEYLLTYVKSLQVHRLHGHLISLGRSRYNYWLMSLYYKQILTYRPN